MCGILAVFGLANGAEANRARILQCIRRIRHRGPDESGVYASGQNIICHERLAIVGGESGHQPLRDETGDLILSANGEIYNHELLRQSALLASRPFFTKSDCEVLLHLACVDDPAGFLNRLNGIFAFVLYDQRKDCYVVARDHVGIVPLYMGWAEDGSVWFASELKVLADQCVRFQEFPPGSLFLSSSQEFVKWYQPPWHLESYFPVVPVDLKELRCQLEAAVIRQTMCETPYGVLLSGGLDSSLVSAIACRHAVQQAHGEAGRIHSFAVGLHGSPDLIAARKAATFLNTRHHEFTFTIQEGLDVLRDVIYHLETFDVTTVRASIPMYLMARRIKALGIKMVLSGEGSDEIFGGYLYFHKAPNAEEFHKETVRKIKALHLYDCLRANKSTAAWGVEARVPFLDKEFVDFAMSLNPADKMARTGKMEKWILRKAFEGYLPDEILWRQKEQFSDGVGYSWIDALKATAEQQVSDEQFASAHQRFPVGPPSTKEAFFYRQIFESHFPQPSAAAAVPSGPSIACSTSIAIQWDKSFMTAADPSGRAVLDIHHDAKKDLSVMQELAPVRDFA